MILSGRGDTAQSQVMVFGWLKSLWRQLSLCVGFMLLRRCKCAFLVTGLSERWMSVYRSLFIFSLVRL